MGKVWNEVHHLPLLGRSMKTLEAMLVCTLYMVQCNRIVYRLFLSGLTQTVLNKNYTFMPRLLVLFSFRNNSDFSTLEETLDPLLAFPRLLFSSSITYRYFRNQ